MTCQWNTGAIHRMESEVAFRPILPVQAARIPAGRILLLDDIQRDALREVANIGAGHAATALSLLTGRKIMITVPRMHASSPEATLSAIAAPDEMLAVVPMSVRGSLEGCAVWVFPLLTASRIVSIVLDHTEIVRPTQRPMLETSVLTETGNILAGAYLGALSEFLRMALLPTPPTLAVGPAEEILSSVLRVSTDPAPAVSVMCMETTFLLDEAQMALPAYFLLFPEPESLDQLLEALSGSRCGWARVRIP